MESIETKALIRNTSAAQIYNDWLNSQGHEAMTGGEAKAQAIVGTEHSAWDGYISGKQLELDKARYIKQSWRSTEFGDQDPDSILEVFLSDTDDGCEVRLVHSDIPDGQGKSYKSGWHEHYFDPMNKYYNSK